MWAPEHLSGLGHSSVMGGKPTCGPSGAEVVVGMAEGAPEHPDGRPWRGHRSGRTKQRHVTWRSAPLPLGPGRGVGFHPSCSSTDSGGSGLNRPLPGRPAAQDLGSVSSVHEGALSGQSLAWQG